MSTMIASFVAILLAVAAMAVGILCGRAPIRGSCGGAGCGACTRSCESRASTDDDAAGRGEGC